MLVVEEPLLAPLAPPDEADDLPAVEAVLVFETAAATCCLNGSRGRTDSLECADALFTLTTGIPAPLLV